MSDALQWFEQGGRRTAVLLPFDVEAMLNNWMAIQRAMIRTRPEEFTRQEWAHLIAVLDRRNLAGVFASTFGEPAAAGGRPQRIARPRGPVAIWLPNNVSLLGPLTLILLSLTGNEIRIKAGSRANDLTTAFVRFLELLDVLRDALTRVRIEQFDRDDPRNAEMAASAKVRIVFGSDAAAAAIDRLPHPIDSVAFAFSDRTSVAWIEPELITDELLVKFIQVFAIYGRAGCTSPRKLVLIGGSDAQCDDVVDRLMRLWPRTVPADLPMHLASENVMAAQWARALEWRAHVAPRNAAVLATGDAATEPETTFFLPVVAASLDDAALQLRHNVQTLGYACRDATFDIWLPVLARTRVKRVVPIEVMHHFGPLWDGWEFWRSTFEEVEVRG